jgi:hypothetical protein
MNQAIVQGFKNYLIIIFRNSEMLLLTQFYRLYLL